MKINSNEIKILYSFFDQIIPSDELMPSATAVEASRRGGAKVSRNEI